MTPMSEPNPNPTPDTPPATQPPAPPKPAPQYGPPQPGAPRPGGGPRGPQNRTGGSGPRSDRPRNDGSAPAQLDRKDFAAITKPNKRQLDADIEAELAAAMGSVDVTRELGNTETQQKPVGAAAAVSLPGGRKRGTVLSVRGKDVFVDVPGGRSQGLLPLLQFEGKTPKVGDVVEFSIERYDSANGLLILTMTGAAQHVSDWSSVALHMIVECKVTGVNKNSTGLLVEVNGIKGFMPISQIDLGRVEDPNQFINQTLKAEVVELDRAERNLILSRKSLLEREREAQREQFWAGLEVGQTRTGTVRGLQPFGAFVDLGASDGLIPVSELSWKRINHPNEVLSVGQRVEVVVRKLDFDARRISLSLKQLLANPWDAFAANHRPGTRIKGTVTRITEFGAFVELAEGIEGLIHISELSTDRVRRVRDVVSEGQEVEVQILNLDPEARRIALSLKTIQAGAAAEQDAVDEAEQEADRAAAAERLANRPVNPNLRGGIGAARIVLPGGNS
jgi:small subunit ribosomal protein S1